MVAHSRAPLRADRLRALNRPVRVGVALGEWGLPLEIVSPISPDSLDEHGGRRRRRVAEILDVWRIDDEWWRAPVSRRYVEVVLEGGGHVVVFEDLTTGSWFLQQP